MPIGTSVVGRSEVAGGGTVVLGGMGGSWKEGVERSEGGGQGGVGGGDRGGGMRGREWEFSDRR